jgi:hypothetical protein
MNLLARPQDQFIHTIDNSFGHFIPKLTNKPHAKIPLSSGMFIIVFIERTGDVLVIRFRVITFQL